jgi:Protein of unknown function (DUF2628)
VTLYSVYEPSAEAPDLTTRADALAFVKEGISWPALFVPALWLIYHRMWIELMVLLAAFGALGWALTYSHDGSDLLQWASIALGVLFAFEANDLRRYALERRGYQLAGVAIGRDSEEAELAFFRTWLPQQTKARVPEHHRRKETPAAMGGGEPEEVIGLFPRP